MSDLVFVTGGSGHIGNRVIVDALAAGYRVRAAVRSHAKAAKIRSTKSISALDPGDKLEFVIVPDLLADGAYDEAIDGATYAIHIASPITDAHRDGESYQTTLVDPAVKGTLNILEAGKRAGSVKRIVITSSVIAIISVKDFTSSAKDKIFNEESRTQFIPEPYNNVFEAYGASKVAALNETEAWMEREKGCVSFDVVNIFPGFVLGRDELMIHATDAIRGTNKFVLGPVTGLDLSYTVGTSVHVRDVALAHVKALDSKIPGNRGYILTSGGIQGTVWEHAFEIVAQSFPAAVESGILSNNGKIISVPVQIDESASEKALGFKFQSFEDQVKDVIEHYLELVATSR